MQSCYRHLWYLVPQTDVFALADPGLSDYQKQRMARKLHSLERVQIEKGKPNSQSLTSFVSTDYWLVFDMLGLVGTQDWLTIPPNLAKPDTMITITLTNLL